MNEYKNVRKMLKKIISTIDLLELKSICIKYSQKDMHSNKCKNFLLECCKLLSFIENKRAINEYTEIYSFSALGGNSIKQINKEKDKQHLLISLFYNFVVTFDMAIYQETLHYNLNSKVMILIDAARDLTTFTWKVIELDKDTELSHKHILGM